MPLTRCHISNEYGLADPVLYRASEKDDPESVLEAVAMAGLVGLLRQLGDLAEFAAEVFRQVHEEVMATAARGNSLMVRVQQLEAEFPSIENAILSQANHSSCFADAGISWHPNLHIKQNLVTCGDLPCFVMDSYEQGRGPPQLFLLDKYDVVGAGACLKRYSDPSFYRVESASIGIANEDAQNEKTTRNMKKMGSQRKNGETLEMGPSSHARLHQLLMKERIQDNLSDPTSTVRLKKRSFNHNPFDGENGRSYMEKFLHKSSPDNKGFHSASLSSLPSEFTSDNSSDSGADVIDIGTVSPMKRSPPGNISTHSSPKVQKVLKPSVNMPSDKNLGVVTIKVPEENSRCEIVDNHSKFHNVITKRCVRIDGESKLAANADQYQHDYAASETDDYTCALATVEVEMATDNEHRPNKGRVSSKVESHETDSDANEEELGPHPQHSNLRSLGNLSLSNDANSSFKRGASINSYSDTLDTSAEDIISHSNGEVKMYPSSESCLVDPVSVPPDKGRASVDSHNVALENNNIEKDKIYDARDASYSSRVVDSSQPLDSEVAAGLNEDSSDDIGRCGVPKADESIETLSSGPLATKADALPPEPTANCAMHESPEGHEISDNKVNQRECPSETSTGNLVYDKIVLPNLSAAEGLLYSQIIKMSPKTDFNLESSTAMLETNTTDKSEQQRYSGVREKFQVRDPESTVGFGSYSREPPAVEDRHWRAWGSDETISLEHSKELTMQMEVNHPGFSLLDVESAPCKSIPFVGQDLDLHDDGICDHYGTQETRGVVLVSDGSMTSAPSLPCNIDSGIKNPSHELEYGENDEASPAYHLCDAAVNFPNDQVSGGSFPADKSASKSSNLQNEDNQYLDYVNQEKSFIASPKPCQEALKGQSSSLGFLSVPAVDLLDDVCPPSGFTPKVTQANDDPCAEDPLRQPPLIANALPSISAELRGSKLTVPSHSVGLDPGHLQEASKVDHASSKSYPNGLVVQLSSSESTAQSAAYINQSVEAAQVNLQEKSQLPPLPPRQWRSGKFQNLLEASHKELSKQNHALLPSTQSHPADGKSQFYFPVSEGETMRPENPRLSLSAMEDKQQDFSEPSADILVIDGNSSQTCLDSKETDSSNEDEHSVLGASSLPPANESTLSIENFAAGTNLQDKTVQDTLQNFQRQDNHKKTSMQETAAGEMHPQNGLQTSDGIVAQSVGTSGVLPDAEARKPKKPPPPMSPYIDAVAAHERSMLRKVSERKRPQIAAKAEERDSLLEQIRTKSFSLKPTVISRPIIQGPRTNLKVAAILEKANQIRQALAGSDDDDDSNSWSDS